MTPAARLGAAIEKRDLTLTGLPAEQVLTNQACKSRYAGLKDREAVRDIVFQSVRARRHMAHLAGLKRGAGWDRDGRT